MDNNMLEYLETYPVVDAIKIQNLWPFASTKIDIFHFLFHKMFRNTDSIISYSLVIWKWFLVFHLDLIH